MKNIMALLDLAQAASQGDDPLAQLVSSMTYAKPRKSGSHPIAPRSPVPPKTNVNVFTPNPAVQPPSFASPGADAYGDYDAPLNIDTPTRDPLTGRTLHNRTPIMFPHEHPPPRMPVDPLPESFHDSFDNPAYPSLTGRSPMVSSVSQMPVQPPDDRKPIVLPTSHEYMVYPPKPPDNKTTPEEYDPDFGITPNMKNGDRTPASVKGDRALRHAVDVKRIMDTDTNTAKPGGHWLLSGKDADGNLIDRSDEVRAIAEEDADGMNRVISESPVQKVIDGILGGASDKEHISRALGEAIKMYGVGGSRLKTFDDGSSMRSRRIADLMKIYKVLNGYEIAPTQPAQK